MNEIALEVTRPADAPGFDRGKRRAALLSLLMIGAVLWPIQENWQAKPRDNFPLSYYPMFSNKREAVEIFFYLVGRDAQGGRHYIPYRWIGDGGGNQTRRQIRKIMNDGRGNDLAKAVAKRVAKRDQSPWTEITSIAACKGEYDVDAFFHGKKEPVSEQIKGFAQVERRTR